MKFIPVGHHGLVRGKEGRTDRQTDDGRDGRREGGREGGWVGKREGGSKYEVGMNISLPPSPQSCPQLITWT